MSRLYGYFNDIKDTYRLSIIFWADPPFFHHYTRFHPSSKSCSESWFIFLTGYSGVISGTSTTSSTWTTFFSDFSFLGLLSVLISYDLGTSVGLSSAFFGVDLGLVSDAFSVVFLFDGAITTGLTSSLDCVWFVVFAGVEGFGCAFGAFLATGLISYCF